MKKVIKSKKVKKDIYAKLYSDLQYNPFDSLSRLKKHVEKIETDEPDYVFFLGDLVDDSKYTAKELRKLYDLLAKMAKTSKVIFVFGNHDQLTKDEKGNWINNYNFEMEHILKNMGIHVLQNESYQDENLFVHGTRFSGSYYEDKEPIGLFYETAKKIDFMGTDKFSVLMEHGTKNTFNKEFFGSFPNLNNVDLVLGGHTHNGAIPWYISKYIPGNKGLIDPYGQIFQDNLREDKQITENTYGIISAPITTFSSSTKLSAVDKILYPSPEQDILIKKR